MFKASRRRQVRRKELLISVQIALVALLAYWLGFRFTALFPGYFPKIGGLWSAISAVIVVQVSKKDTADSAWLRLIGTALGAAISALYLSLSVSCGWNGCIDFLFIAYLHFFEYEQLDEAFGYYSACGHGHCKFKSSAEPSAERLVTFLRILHWLCRCSLLDFFVA